VEVTDDYFQKNNVLFSAVPSGDTAHSEHTDCNRDCCCTAGKRAASEVASVCIGRLLCCAVLCC
jgi:hypothetical protein